MPLFPQRKIVPHDPPNWVPDGSFLFITLACVERGRNQLCVPGVSEQLIQAAKFYHEKGDWHCRLFLLMPDHLHALAGFSSDSGLVAFVRKFKIYAGKSCGVKWQRDFFDHRPRNGKELDAKSEYIRQNPVRAGLVANPDEWKHVWSP